MRALTLETSDFETKIGELLWNLALKLWKENNKNSQMLVRTAASVKKHFIVSFELRVRQKLINKILFRDNTKHKRNSFLLPVELKAKTYRGQDGDVIDNVPGNKKLRTHFEICHN